jgi:tetratricopeptide (TPR) repeat protein
MGTRKFGLLTALVCASFLCGQPAGRDAEIQQRYQRAQQALAAKRLDDAAREFREILKLNPAIAGAYANLGLLAYQQGQYGEASRELRAALERDRSLTGAEDLLGMSLAREGRTAEALPLLEKCFRRGGREDYRLEAGLLLFEIDSTAQRLHEAIEVLWSLEAQYPNDPDVLYAAYRLHADLGAKSLASLMKAAPDSARLHQVTAELLESDGDYPHAVDQYRRALAANPALPGLGTALGVAILNSSQEAEARAEARKEFEAELKLNPRDEHAEYQLGEIAWWEHRPEEATAHYARAVELQPKFVEALLGLAKAWLLAGKTTEARKLLAQAVEFEPANEVAHYRLAQAARKLGDEAEAAKELAEFKRLRAESASISKIYQQVRKRDVTPQSVEAEPK